MRVGRARRPLALAPLVVRVYGTRCGHVRAYSLIFFIFVVFVCVCCRGIRRIPAGCRTAGEYCLTGDGLSCEFTATEPEIGTQVFIVYYDNE